MSDVLITLPELIDSKIRGYIHWWRFKNLTIAEMRTLSIVHEVENVVSRCFTQKLRSFTQITGQLTIYIPRFRREDLLELSKVAIKYHIIRVDIVEIFKYLYTGSYIPYRKYALISNTLQQIKDFLQKKNIDFETMPIFSIAQKLGSTKIPKTHALQLLLTVEGYHRLLQNSRLVNTGLYSYNVTDYPHIIFDIDRFQEKQFHQTLKDILQTDELDDTIGFNLYDFEPVTVNH